MEPKFGSPTGPSPFDQSQYSKEPESEVHGGDGYRTQSIINHAKCLRIATTVYAIILESVAAIVMFTNIYFLFLLVALVFPVLGYFGTRYFRIWMLSVFIGYLSIGSIGKVLLFVLTFHTDIFDRIPQGLFGFLLICLAIYDLMLLIYTIYFVLRIKDMQRHERIWLIKNRRWINY